MRKTQEELGRPRLTKKKSYDDVDRFSLSHYFKAMKFVLLIAILLSGYFSFAQSAEPKAAIHLVTYQSWGFTVDTTPQGQRVRRIIERSKALGFKTVIFNFRGHMITGRSSDIRSTVPLSEQATEERLLLESAEYAKSLGMSVAFRPILLVVGPKGEFPYIENRKTYWWHGIIAPTNPTTWFEAYYKFHERYLKLAAKAGAEWYSIGAEMHSMTSGLGAREPSRPLGYPGKWAELVRRARNVLGPNIQITYGVNYTDQYVIANGQKSWGGELEQWRFFMTEPFTTPSYVKHQKDLHDFWSQLDVIGIDYYRAIGSTNDRYGNEHSALVRQLLPRVQSHASQLDNILTEIAMTVGYERPLYFQEAGYRSVEKCFLDPSSYESDGGKFSLVHQAAAWDAFFKGYWEPQWPWMAGVGVWQVLVDEETNGATDTGFTPLGKKPVEDVLRFHLKPINFRP